MIYDTSGIRGLCRGPGPGTTERRGQAEREGLLSSGDSFKAAVMETDLPLWPDPPSHS